MTNLLIPQKYELLNLVMEKLNDPEPVYDSEKCNCGGLPMVIYCVLQCVRQQCQ